MSEPIYAQLLKINLGYEVLIQQFIENLLKYPGCHCNVPLPLFKGQTNEAYNDEKQDICNRTAEVLTMMGMTVEHGVNTFTLMVKPEDEKYK